MQIFKTIAHSVYGPDFYQNIKKRSFAQALGYSFFIMFIAILLGALILGVQFAQEVSFKPGQIEEGITELYPDELELTFENGLLSTNVEEPYMVTIGESLGELFDVESDFNLVVIDTNTAFSAEQFYAYETVAWLGKDAVHALDDQNLQTIPYGEADGFTLDEMKVAEFAETASNFVLPLALGILFFGSVFGLLFLTAGRLFMNLFFGLIVFLVCKAKKIDWDYGTSYIASLHMLTLYTFVVPITLLFSFEIPFLRLGLLVVVLGMNLYKIKK